MVFYFNNWVFWRVGECDIDDLYLLLVDIWKIFCVFFVFYIIWSCWRLWVCVLVFFVLWGFVILDFLSSGVCRGFECWREFLCSRVSGFIEFFENGGYFGRIDLVFCWRWVVIIWDCWVLWVFCCLVWVVVFYWLLWKLYLGFSVDGYWLDDRIVWMFGRCF